jgi:hypothetical protein
MKRLVCIVEGWGDVRAVPTLCARILAHLNAEGWIVDSEPVRRPRSLLVDERVPSPNRPSRRDELGRALTLALARPAHGVLVICDSDDDCPAIWNADAAPVIGQRTAGGAIMAVREYEAWLLHTFPAEVLRRHGIANPDRIRNGKRALSHIIPGHLPTTHQLELTRKLDIEAVRSRSPSFAKLVRDIERICVQRPEQRAS